MHSSNKSNSKVRSQAGTSATNRNQSSGSRTNFRSTISGTQSDGYQSRLNSGGGTQSQSSIGRNIRSSQAQSHGNSTPGYGSNSSATRQRSQSVSRLSTADATSQRSLRPQSSVGRNVQSSQSQSHAGNSSFGNSTNSSVSRQRSQSVSRLSTADATSQRSLRPQSSVGRNERSSQVQSHTGNSSTSGYGANSSASQQSLRINDDDQRSQSISRLNTANGTSQRSLRPQSNVEYSQSQYPSQNTSSSSIRNPTTSSAKQSRMFENDQRSQSFGRSQPVSNSSYTSRRDESNNGRSGVYDNVPSMIDSDDDDSQNIQQRTRSEVQRSQLQQQEERQQQRRNLSNQTNQPPSRSASQSNVNKNTSGQNLENYPQKEFVEENRSECQQEQQQQCERMAAFSIRTRQVYCIPRDQILNVNQNCHRFKILPQTTPCVNEEACCFSWAHFCVCPIRCILFIILLLFCVLVFFAVAHIFGVFLDKWDEYNSKYY